MSIRLLDCGEGAVTIEFGDRIDEALAAQAAGLATALRHAVQQRRLEGVIEVVPTFRSVTVIFDPLRLDPADLAQQLPALLASQEAGTRERVRIWRIPVCYGGSFGPDLEAIAERLDWRHEAVVEAHCQADYRVAMLGFQPGFAFMTGLPSALQLPRRSEPRVRVPAGSVAIATALTAIYPWESPGGWHLIGRCPLPLFAVDADPPALLAPGDRVRFLPIDAQEFAALESAACAGDADASPERLDGGCA
ncbi:MAG: 5-oxoprolinase subunit PxpB [Rhodocyclaceae bacterium]|nr:5-oxoprolinase subunit PxpB [Rhodocyclaceae bacterium]